MCDLLVPLVIVLLVSKRKTRMPIQVFWTAFQFCMQHCDQSVNAVFENNRCLKKLFWDMTHFHWVTGSWPSLDPGRQRHYGSRSFEIRLPGDAASYSNVNHTGIQTFKTHIIDVNFENRLKHTWICERSAESFGFKTLGNRSVWAYEP